MACQNDGAELFYPKNDLENSFFASLVPDKHLFLNINDEQNEGDFVTDGKPINYERFCDGEPSNAHGIEHFLAIWRGKNYNGISSNDCWNDIGADRVKKDTLALCIYRVPSEDPQ